MKEAEAKEHFAMLMELKSYLMSVKVPEVISGKCLYNSQYSCTVLAF